MILVIKLDLIKATLDFALQREDIRDEVLSYLKDGI